MLEGKRILAIMLNRNIEKEAAVEDMKEIDGIPLTKWLAKFKKISKYIDECIPFPKEEDITKRWGGGSLFHRLSELAHGDLAGKKIFLQELERHIDYDHIILLETRLDLRMMPEIDRAIENCFSHTKDSCIVMTEVDCSPFWQYTMEENLIDEEKLPIAYERGRPIRYKVLNYSFDLEKVFLYRKRVFREEGKEGLAIPAKRAYSLTNFYDHISIEAVLFKLVRMK